MAAISLEMGEFWVKWWQIRADRKNGIAPVYLLLLKDDDLVQVQPRDRQLDPTVGLAQQDRTPPRCQVDGFPLTFTGGLQELAT